MKRVKISYEISFDFPDGEVIRDRVADAIASISQAVLSGVASDGSHGSVVLSHGVHVEWYAQIEALEVV